MIIFNAFLLIFAIAFMGCILATPMATRLAHRLGAIDRPDQFRRIHKGATPRMGGLGLAAGIAAGIGLVVAAGYLDGWAGLVDWVANIWALVAAGLIILAIGVVDDARGIGPRMKLLGQAAAVIVLYLGRVQIESIALGGYEIDLGRPSFDLVLLGRPVHVAVPSLLATMFWFLACMNIWNLIDGMDGLASGVGLLVSGTLMLVAIHHENVGVAILAAGLAGSLAGFLLYNWHPACVFLGDSGSLLIGLMIGVIGVQGSLKGPSTISILFPILAMGLPISDTAMAIFRRWVRNLPLSSADRRHIHHLLIGLGLDPRQAALLLYCFSGFLCGAVLLGVALKSEFLAVVLGLSGCLAFLLILTSRRDELQSLRDDFAARMIRGRQERFAAKATWEAIQRVELCDNFAAIGAILHANCRALGCEIQRLTCRRDGRLVFDGSVDPTSIAVAMSPGDEPAVSAPSATFRLSSGRDMMLTVALRQSCE